MKITKITYQRVRNLGDCETERVEATVSVDESDNIHEAFKYLKAYVLSKLCLPIDQDAYSIEDDNRFSVIELDQ